MLTQISIKASRKNLPLCYTNKKTGNRMPVELPKHHSDKPRLVRFPATLEALGAVIHFLALDNTFGSKPLANVVLEVLVQLQNKWNVCAVREKTLVGYCGWVLTKRELAEMYLKDESGRDPIVSPNEADAAILTIVRILEPKLVPPLIRASRKLNPGKRCFFRREYQDHKKPKRGSSVLNAMVSENLHTPDQIAPLTIKISPS
jgi:hypothetical protein